MQCTCATSSAADTTSTTTNMCATSARPLHITTTSDAATRADRTHATRTREFPKRNTQTHQRTTNPVPHRMCYANTKCMQTQHPRCLVSSRASGQAPRGCWCVILQVGVTTSPHHGWSGLRCQQEPSSQPSLEGPSKGRKVSSRVSHVRFRVPDCYTAERSLKSAERSGYRD